MKADLLIKNALIYDGTGDRPRMGEVAVKDGKTDSVLPRGTMFDCDAAVVIDAGGLSLAPGFIDSHSHSDQNIMRDPEREQVLKMGVTTEIAGQCGNTAFPIPENSSGRSKALWHEKFGEYVFTSFKEAADAIPAGRLGVNQAWYTGHCALRCAVMGYEDRKAEKAEIEAMRSILELQLKQGSMGLSTGLAYVPGIYSDEYELVEISKILRKYGAFYSSHTRSESAGLFDAVRECGNVAQKAGVPGTISHFKACYPDFWDRMDAAVGLVEEMRKQGTELTFDAYPYNAVSTVTMSAIPAAFQTEGDEVFAERLADREFTDAIKHEIYEVDDPSWDNALKHAGADKFLIVSAPVTPEIEGLTYTELAQRLGCEPFDAVVWALRKNRGKIYDVRFIIKEENVEKVLAHPLCTVGSDGIFRRGVDRTCHPRAFGTFPRYLGHYIREREILPREEGIRRITGLPAERYGLASFTDGTRSRGKGKGFILPGFDADYTLFDYDGIRANSDYKHPMEGNDGIERVIMQGTTVLKSGELTGCFCGNIIKRTDYR